MTARFDRTARGEYAAARLFEYQTLFDARGDLYNLANVLYPEARAREAAAILRHLDVAPSARWLDVYAGGGYLSRRAAEQGLPAAAAACDGSLPFVRSGSAARACVARGQALPFPSGHFGGVACLAALHHAENPAALAAELLRVVAPRGRAAIGDVAEGSSAAAFLNDFVHRHTADGHRGRFHALPALEDLLARAGGVDARGDRTDVAWTLPSRDAALDFCRHLFGLEPETRDREIEAALRDAGASEDGKAFRIPWPMCFVSAARA